MQTKAPQFERSPIALYALIVVNLIPIYGVVHWNWSVFEIVFLYWCENLIVGFITALKIITSNPDYNQGFAISVPGKGTQRIPLPDNLPANALAMMKLFIVPFFIFHYGMFCMGHGVFVIGMFGDEQFGSGIYGNTLGLLSGPLLIFVSALFVSHMISFFGNFIGNGENRRTNPMELMMSPYQRIVVLHLTIIFGAGATMMLGTPFWLLAVLVVLKTFMDVRSHLNERKRFSAGAEPIAEPETPISNLA
ncbi:MAG: DUF6498-containing protein [Gammaproteobacteria bacterium]